MRYLIAILVAGALAGCLKLSQGDEIGPLPTNITVYLSSTPDSTNGHLTLLLAGGDYDYRVRIVTQLTISGNDISIQVVNTVCDEPCFEAQYDSDRTGYGFITFPFLPNGNYDLNVTAENHTRNGTLEVADNRFELDIELPSPLEFSINRKYAIRTPSNALICAFDGVDYPFTVQEAMDSLALACDFEPINLPPERYYRFDIMPNGLVDPSCFPDADTVIAVRYNGDRQALENAFNAWHLQEWQDDISVKFRDAMGYYKELPE